jgi:hypothetical protein
MLYQNGMYEEIFLKKPFIISIENIGLLEAERSTCERTIKFYISGLGVCQ